MPWRALLCATLGGGGQQKGQTAYPSTFTTVPNAPKQGALDLVTKFYSAPLFPGKGGRGIAGILQEDHQGAREWCNCSEEVIKVLVKYFRDNDELKLAKSLRVVNRHWCTTISRLCTSIKPTDLEMDEFNKLEKAMASRFVNIYKLELPASWMEDVFCQRIAAFKNLSELDFFWFDNVTDDGLKHIASLPQLSSLKIYHCRQVSDKGIKHLSRSGVRTLWLYGGTLLTDEGLSMLATCYSLKELRLMYCNTITKKGLEFLVRRPEMKLTVRFCRRIPCDIHIA